MIRLAIVAAFTFGLCFAQSAPEQAQLDGLAAANWQQRNVLLRNQLDKAKISEADFHRATKEGTDFMAGLRAKWEKSPYLPIFDAAQARGIRELAAGKTPQFQQPPAAPRSPVHDSEEFPNPYPQVFGLLAAVVGAVLLVAWFLREKESTGGAPALSDNFGTAAYAPQAVVMPNPFYANRGVFFGKSSSPEQNGRPLHLNPGAPVCSTPEHHTLIVARTRTGKGTRVIIPTLARYFGSVLAIDPKGELASISARGRAAFSEVHIINPWGELAGTFQKLGFKTATYNPLDILDRNDPNVVAIAQALAASICPVRGAKDDFWKGNAANVLAAVFLWLTDQPGERKTLARAREIVSLTRKDFTDKYLTKMAASSAFEGAIRELAAPFIDLAQETYSGVMSNVSEATKFLSDPQVKASTATSSFSMEDLVNRVTTVYLVIPPDRIDTQRTWLRLLITAGMHTFKRMPVNHRPPHRCMFLIDEFAALGRLDELPRDIATMSGYGVDFTLIIQGIDQLKDQYGDAHATILSNCAFKWFCNVNDLHSAEYLSKTLGQKTVGTVSKSESSGVAGKGMTEGSSTSFGEAGRSLLNPDEVLNLGRDTAILLHPNSKPHYIRPVDYWQLETAFASLKETYPNLYWNPPFQVDPNPYHKPTR